MTVSSAPLASERMKFQAFTDLGIENPIESVGCAKQTSGSSAGNPSDSRQIVAYAGGVLPPMIEHLVIIRAKLESCASHGSMQLFARGSTTSASN